LMDLLSIKKISFLVISILAIIYKLANCSNFESPSSSLEKVALSSSLSPSRCFFFLSNFDLFWYLEYHTSHDPVSYTYNIWYHPNCLALPYQISLF
jgi:hypothetical protein